MNETGVYDFKLEYTFAGNALAGRAPCPWIGSSA